MTMSPDLLTFTKPLRRVLVYLASRDLRPNQQVTFVEFTVGYRLWGRHELGDRMLDLCLRKLARTGIVTYEEQIAVPDRTFVMTPRGVMIAEEAYHAAKRNIDDFASLLPKKPTAEMAPPMTPPNLLRVSTLGARPSIDLMSFD